MHVSLPTPWCCCTWRSSSSRCSAACSSHGAWLAWLHLPAAAWAAAIEFSGAICPLTPLENRFRRLAGESGYPGGFVEHYLIPIVYPPGLDPAIQRWLGALVVAANLAVYLWAVTRRRKRVRPDSAS